MLNITFSIETGNYTNDFTLRFENYRDALIAFEEHRNSIKIETECFNNETEETIVSSYNTLTFYADNFTILEKEYYGFFNPVFSLEEFITFLHNGISNCEEYKARIYVCNFDFNTVKDIAVNGIDLLSSISNTIHEYIKDFEEKAAKPINSFLEHYYEGVIGYETMFEAYEEVREKLDVLMFFDNLISDEIDRQIELHNYLFNEEK